MYEVRASLCQRNQHCTSFSPLSLSKIVAAFSPANTLSGPRWEFCTLYTLFGYSRILPPPSSRFSRKPFPTIASLLASLSCFVSRSFFVAFNGGGEFSDFISSSHLVQYCDFLLLSSRSPSPLLKPPIGSNPGSPSLSLSNFLYLSSLYYSSNLYREEAFQITEEIQYYQEGNRSTLTQTART